MTTTIKKIVSLGLLASALAPVALAQIIDRPANSGPVTSNTNTYIIAAVVAVVLVGAFLFFRSKKDK
jgi:LPXTG-motif cell wall-anchored protein